MHQLTTVKYRSDDIQEHLNEMVRCIFQFNQGFKFEHSSEHTLVLNYFEREFLLELTPILEIVRINLDEQESIFSIDHTSCSSPFS